MISFSLAVDYVLRNECDPNHFDKVTINENDRGGITKYGISFRFLKSIPPERLRKYNIYVIDQPTEHDIKTMTIVQAREIYKNEFWDHAPFEKINVDGIRNYIFDMAVSMGIAPAIKCAQRACWAVEASRDLQDDGIMGTNTVNAINLCGTSLIYPLRAERACYYKGIVESNPPQEVFLEGWLNRAYE